MFAIEKPEKKIMGRIPCLWLNYVIGADKILVFFHGNAEDVGLSFELLEHVQHVLHCHILAVEYPGYGIYRTEDTSEEAILRDAEAVFDYLTDECKIDSKDIILFGRSLGSGPSSYLASIKDPGALILMSPFTSICGAV